MHQRFRRPVSTVERIWLGIDSVTPPYVIQAVMEGHGGVDFDHLRMAVAKASQANPGSRLILRGALKGTYWLDSGISPRVRRVAGQAWDGYSSDNAPFLSDHLPGNGPTCEVLLVEGPTPRLVFRASHAVMDGRGLYTWAEDVFRVLRGQEPIGTSSTLTEAGIMSKITDKTRMAPTNACIAPTGSSRPSRPGATWRRLSFEGSFPNLLGKVGWALAQSAWQFRDGSVGLMIPVDLRSRQPGLRSTGNLSIALYVDVTKDSTPASIAHEVKNQLDQKYDCMSFEGGTYIDYIPIKILGLSIQSRVKKSHRKGLYGTSAMISNLGRIDISKYCGGGFYTESTFGLPVPWNGFPVFIVLTGTKDRVDMIFSVPNTLATENRLERLLTDIRRVVVSAPTIPEHLEATRA
jgi:hypothetical protein